MPFPWLAAIQAGGSVIQGASGFFGGGSERVHWGDIKKNIQYNKATGLQNVKYQKQIRRQQWREKKRQTYWNAKHFGKIAEKMGVSRYALMGNQMSSHVPGAMVPPSGSVAPRRGKDSTAQTMAAMGQSIVRGASGILQMQQAASQMKVDEAQAKLLNAQAEKIINQTQGTPGLGFTEENITHGEDIHAYQEGLKERGGQMQVQPMLAQSGIIRQMPSRDAQDWISESIAAQGLFWKDRHNYAQKINRGQRAKRGPEQQFYYNEKKRLEYIFKKPVIWDPHVKVRFSFMKKKEIYGSWRLQNY